MRINLKNIKKIKILSPSNPFVKGTSLVRAAIKKLQVEGYDFEYIELQKMPNEVVLEHLNISYSAKSILCICARCFLA